MLIKKGSVKDIYRENDQLYFKFSDRYSIFDWGQMPDQITNKGLCLYKLADYFFKLFEDQGIKTHFLKAEDEKLYVKEFHVPSLNFSKGQWDYSFYADKKAKNCIIPLECIFRFGIPEGSSLLKRATDKSYMESIGINSEIKVDDIFDKPILEFSTKLESTDRYIGYKEAMEISGMTESEFEKFLSHIHKISCLLKDKFNSLEINMWDGKFEFAFDETRDFVLIDSVGPDELRLTIDGIQLSKENLRHFYQDGSWHKATSKAKSLAKERDSKEWKKICIDELKEEPAPLSGEFKEFALSLYPSLTNYILTKSSLPKVVSEAKEIDELIEYFKNYKTSSRH